jgi:adenylosuccinate synthase
VCDLQDWNAFEEKYRSLLAMHERVFNYTHEDAEAELSLLKDLREKVLAMSADTALYLNTELTNGKTVLMEGANAALLDIDHGTYPYVTSSNPSIGGIFTGCGIHPGYLDENIGIVKAYMTRVGRGPFPTELDNDLGEKIRTAGGEFGSTTGRPRRCGWFDAPLTKYAIMINGHTSLNLTKLDVLDDLDEIKVAEKYFLDGKEIHSLPSRLEDLARVELEYSTHPGWKTDISNSQTWDDLPENAQNYVLHLESLLGCPIKWIGVGARRDQMIER